MAKPSYKPRREVDAQFARKIRQRDGVCIAGMLLERTPGKLADGLPLCACAGELDAHHITTRGAGGGDNLENGILLCRRHHQLAHMNTIPRENLRAWLSFLHGEKHGNE